MSTTSDLLASATQTIKDLRSADETPPGEQGDEFAPEMDSYVDAVKARFGAIVNDNDEVTADVNNALTQSEELSVSDSQPVTAGPVGDGGEFVPLTSFRLYGGLTTTSTTWEQAGPNGDREQVDLGAIDLTNISGLYGSYTAQLDGAKTWTDFEIRLFMGGSVTGTETVHANPSYSTFSSDIAPLSSETGVPRAYLEMKVGSGEGGLYTAPTITVWGEIA